MADNVKTAKCDACDSERDDRGAEGRPSPLYRLTLTDEDGTVLDAARICHACIHDTNVGDILTPGALDADDERANGPRRGR